MAEIKSATVTVCFDDGVEKTLEFATVEGRTVQHSVTAEPVAIANGSLHDWDDPQYTVVNLTLSGQLAVQDDDAKPRRSSRAKANQE